LCEILKIKAVDRDVGGVVPLGAMQNAEYKPPDEPAGPAACPSRVGLARSKFVLLPLINHLLVVTPDGKPDAVRAATTVPGDCG
jgi:hypothetical protein